MQTFDPVRVGEKADLSIGFTRWLATAETITSVVGGKWTATVLRGTDPSPEAIISGNAAVSGPNVVQRIVPLVSGVTYRLDCEIVTSNGQELIGYGELRVEEPT